ncbi:hypothetical protein HOE07_04210 [archaeon]|jgi:hypothetical protein|nr:hypothetical protein [archaeon]
MTITKEELNKIIEEPNADIEKITSISSDGKNFLIRIPKEISEFLEINKGDKINWLVDMENKELSIKLIKNDEKEKEN